MFLTGYDKNICWKSNFLLHYYKLCSVGTKEENIVIILHITMFLGKICHWNLEH